MLCRLHSADWPTFLGTVYCEYGCHPYRNIDNRFETLSGFRNCWGFVTESEGRGTTRHTVNSEQCHFIVTQYYNSTQLREDSVEGTAKLHKKNVAVSRTFDYFFFEQSSYRISVFWYLGFHWVVDVKAFMNIFLVLLQCRDRSRNLSSYVGARKVGCSNEAF